MVLLANAPANTIRGALWWMMGSVADATPGTVLVMAAYVAVGGTALLALGRDLDVLAIGEEAAAGLGLNVDAATRRVFFTAALLAAASVAAAGLVGFVGLVVPQLVRSLGARRQRAAIGASALLGGALVVAADVVARMARPPAELPLGAVTALLGVPFFLARLRRVR
jgi:iron complex transport system permease protein